MLTLGVCLETVFANLPVSQRIGKIAGAGYPCVEFWHPEGTWDGNQVDFEQAKDADELRQACQQHGVTLNDFAMHAWDGSIGGCPVRAEDREQYLTQIRKMIDFGKAAGCSTGITLSDTVSREAQHRASIADVHAGGRQHMDVLKVIVLFVQAMLVPKVDLVAENVVSRHQLAVLKGPVYCGV